MRVIDLLIILCYNEFIKYGILSLDDKIDEEVKWEKVKKEMNNKKRKI